MKQKIGALLTAALILFGLTSCGKDSPPDKGWAAAYQKYLTDMYEEREQKKQTEENIYVEDPCFDLFYLDEDDVPELVVTDGFSHAGSATIVTWADGMLRQFSDLGSNGAIFYKKRCNQIVGQYVGSGAEYTEVYHLENGNLITDWTGFRLDPSNEMEIKEIRYESFHISVDQQTYDTCYARFVPDWFCALEDPFDTEKNSFHIAMGTTMLLPTQIEQYMAEWENK